MPHRSLTNTRAQAVARVREQLVRQGFPRLQMALIVALTGAFGLLASYSLLHAGLGSMVLHDPLSLALASLFFLHLIWLWLRTHADDWLTLPICPADCPAACLAASRAGAVATLPGAAPVAPLTRHPPRRWRKQPAPR